MKTVFFIFVFLISLASFSQQSDFTVAPGTQRTLTPAERTLSLKNFTLGDNCSIIIPPSMDGWTVTATDVTIGKNVQIVGMGAHGGAGTAGITGATGASCMPGGNGGNGSVGVPGGHGKNVSLSLRIRNIGSLRVNVIGGNGGFGGQGGYGGRGGSRGCTCDGGTGGNGGNGGRGGDGGNGGTVNITYSPVGSATVSNSNFIVVNTGGRAGTGGIAGTEGAGGSQIACSDPKAQVRSVGANGKPGIPGLTANQGANGVTTLQQQ